MAIIALSRLISIPPSSLHSQKPALLQSYAPALLHPCSAALLHSCSPSLLQNSPHTNLHSFPTAFPPFCPFAFQLSYTVKWREPNWQNLAPIWPQLPNWPNDLRASLAPWGQFWSIQAKKGQTGTISTPPKSELAQLNSIFELFLNLALPRAGYDLPIWPQ